MVYQPLGFPSTSSSTDSSALPSLYCSHECSRCESLASKGDVANLMDLHDQNVDGDMVDSMIDSGLPHEVSSTELHSRMIINVHEGFELQVKHPIHTTDRSLF